MKIPHHFPSCFRSVESWTPETKCSVFVQSCMYLYVRLDENIEGVRVMGCRIKWENFIIIYLLLLIVKLFIQKLFIFLLLFLGLSRWIYFRRRHVWHKRHVSVLWIFLFSNSIYRNFQHYIIFNFLISLFIRVSYNLLKFIPCSNCYCHGLEWGGLAGGGTQDLPPRIENPQMSAMSPSNNDERIKYLPLLRHAFHVDK